MLNFVKGPSYLYWNDPVMYNCIYISREEGHLAQTLKEKPRWQQTQSSLKMLYLQTEAMQPQVKE